MVRVKTPFDNDAELADGPVDIADSLTPPPEYGVFGIRWPYRLLQGKKPSIRLLLWTCMDRRILRPVYDRMLAHGYDPSEILLLSMGGGPLQAGKDRVMPLQSIFEHLSGNLPNLEKVWAVAHTNNCAGLKFMCGGRPLVEALKPQIKFQAQDKGIGPELYATQLLLTGNFRLVPEEFQRLIEFAVAEPDEPNKSVNLRSSWFAPDDAKMLQDIIQ